MVWITLDDAAGYAAWASKRIPDSDEWERAILGAGSAIVTGEVWELTTSPPIAGACVVRGGRWRDRPQDAARAGILSHTTAAADQ